jgi:hypothetical protein
MTEPTEGKVSQGMLRLAVESCPSGMVMSDGTGKIVLVFNLSQVQVRPLVEQAIEANRGFAEGYGA